MLEIKNTRHWHDVGYTIIVEIGATNQGTIMTYFSDNVGPYIIICVRVFKILGHARRPMYSKFYHPSGVIMA